MQSLSSLLFSLTLLYFFKQLVSQSIGDTCVDATNNLRGTCQLLFACSHVIRRKINGGSYSRCGFEDSKELVCCAERNIVSSEMKTPDTTKKYVQKCEDYKKKSFDKINFVTRLSYGAAPIEKITSKCSNYTFPLVVGGEDALPREFPHMVLLGCKDMEGKYIWDCGGSLISTNYVLTAAHCFKGSRCESINIAHLGDLNVETETDDAVPKDFGVKNIILHPEYNRSLRYNDIALVELESEVEFSDYMRPACLPYEHFNKQSQLIVAGWGSKQIALPNTAHLQKAAVEEFEHDECNLIFTDNGTNYESTLNRGVEDTTQICAGSKQEMKDTCQGDSGGPLQTVHPNHPCMYSIIGITSYGQSCGNIGIPGIYTRVFNYIKWIESVVWN